MHARRTKTLDLLDDDEDVRSMRSAGVLFESITHIVDFGAVAAAEVYNLRQIEDAMIAGKGKFDNSNEEDAAKFHEDALSAIGNIFPQ